MRGCLTLLRKIGDRGAAGLEYAAATLLAAILISTAAFGVASTAPQLLGERVSGTICRAFAVLPGLDPTCADLGIEDTAGGLPQEDGTPVEEPVPYRDRSWTYADVTAGTMVFIGDSYGSGEGAGDYTDESDRGPSWWDDLRGNDVPENRCHRSANAWGPAIGDQHWPDRYSFMACSGAVTDDVQNDNHSGNDGEGPQGDAVTPDTSMVFVSMGGNDMGFADVLTSCNQLHGGMDDCQAHWDGVDPDDAQGRSRFQVRLDQLEADLRAMYAFIREQSEDGAHVVHMGYPRLFDESYGGRTSTLSHEDAMWANDKADLLNAMMARVAREEGVHFIDPSEAFADHGVGSDDPWVLSFGVGPNRAFPPEAFHPTAEGQAAMQQLVEDYLQSLEP